MPAVGWFFQGFNFIHQFTAMIAVTEKLISLKDAAELLGVTLKTIYVWANRPSHRLETARAGGRKIVTSVEACQRFLVQSESDQPNESQSRILPTGLSRESAIQQLQALQSM